MDNSNFSIQKLFGVFANPQTYLNLIYLFLTFPLGLAYFILLVTGVSLGFGLLIIWIGLLILAALLAISWACVHFERLLAIHLLKVNLPQQEIRSVPGETIFHRIRRYLTNPVTWKGLAYLLLKFPLGTISFVVAVTLLSISIALVFTPLVYPFWPVNIVFIRINSLPLALVAMVIGIFATPLSLHLLNLIAELWAKFTAVMLEPEKNETLTANPVG